jgi:putative effector of murein hydrolase LrgA (UPF0299 family)
MKRFVSFVLIVAVSTMLSLGCAGKTADKSKSKSGEPAKSASEKSPEVKSPEVKS